MLLGRVGKGREYQRLHTGTKHNGVTEEGRARGANATWSSRVVVFGSCRAVAGIITTPQFTLPSNTLFTVPICRVEQFCRYWL